MTSRAAASTAAAPVAVAPVTVPVKHHQQRKALAVLYALTEMESREGHWNPTKMALKPSGTEHGSSEHGSSEGATGCGRGVREGQPWVLAKKNPHQEMPSDLPP
ncbi:hypothetical protein V6N13_034312 [Hibiscus sabdariffa]